MGIPVSLFSNPEIARVPSFPLWGTTFLFDRTILTLSDKVILLFDQSIIPSHTRQLASPLGWGKKEVLHFKWGERGRRPRPPLPLIARISDIPEMNVRSKH